MQSCTKYQAQHVLSGLEHDEAKSGTPLTSDPSYQYSLFGNARHTIGARHRPANAKHTPTPSGRANMHHPSTSCLQLPVSTFQTPKPHGWGCHAWVSGSESCGGLENLVRISVGRAGSVPDFGGGFPGREVWWCGTRQRMGAVAQQFPGASNTCMHVRAPHV
ncbi:hypothetical protein PSPO01_03464 [Paraphaeosphaeria sporulosa]